jgi:hypothetical protein
MGPLPLPVVAGVLRHKAAAAALWAGAFAVGLAPATDGDVWWHLAAGREMVRTRSLLAVDPFSVGAGGRPWVDVHWLFQLGAYGLFCVGGLAALVVAKCLFIATGTLLLAHAVKQQSGSRAALAFSAVVLAALFAARSLLLLRPVVVTLLFLAMFFVLLERFRREPRLAVLLPLPLLQIVWSNCQGLFALGPVLVGAYLIGGWAGDSARGQRSGRSPAVILLLCLLLCVAACGVTPYGLSAISLPSKLLGRLVPGGDNVYAENVVENVPPLSHDLAGAFWHLKWFLACLALGFVLAGRRVVFAHALIVVAFVFLALIGNRNVLLLYWMATPIAVMSAWPGARRILAISRRKRATWALLRSASVVAGGALLLFPLRAAWGEPSIARPAPLRAPVESARLLATGPGAGTIFAADEYGGYLIWSLYPRYRPFMDTRLILRSPSEFAEYLDVVDRPEHFDAFQKSHGFDYVILPVAYPDRYLGLIAHLYASPQWELVFADGAETLFAWRDASRIGRGADGGLGRWNLGSRATTDRTLASLAAQYSGSPPLHDAARVGLATLDVAVGEIAEAERVLSTSSSPEARLLLARCRLAAGDLPGAQALGERSLQDDGDDVRGLNLLAVVSLRRGQPGTAITFLRRSLAADPYDPEAERILSSLEKHVDSP